MARTALIALVAAQDPWYRDSDDERRLGPALSALADRPFDSLILLCRPQRKEEASRLVAAVRELHPQVRVELEPLEFGDPPEHAELLAKFRVVAKRCATRAQPPELHILLPAEVPEAHAAWLLLSLSGEVKASVYQLRRPGPQGQKAGRLLRKLRWGDPVAKLSPTTLSLLLDKRGELYDEAAVVQAGAPSEHLFTPRSVEIARQLAASAAPSLIQAEPGTQKTLFAALIHQLAGRDGPLIIFNCATAAEEFAEKALFGEAEGPSAGPGKIEQAAQGSLVLIKFQKLEESLQLALLRAAEDGEYSPVGSKARVRMSTRIIVTTDLDLSVEVTRGRFNAEVFRRLRAGLVRLPPLRERPGDLPVLIRDEIERANRRQPRPKRLLPEASAKLESYHWPSNISELRRVIEQAFLNAPATTIGPDDIEFDLSTNIENHFVLAPPRIRKGFSIEAYLSNVKRELVQIALRKSHGNQSQAARMLGVTPQAVNKFVRGQRVRPSRGRS